MKTTSQTLKQSGEFINIAYQKLMRAETAAKFGIVLTGILILAAAAYLSLAYNWPKFSRAEVFFAECVKEMFQADNMVTPLYHGTPFFDKPILVYWFIAASYKVLGLSHFAARIPSIIAALGTIALTAFAARNLFCARAGTIAAAVLASSMMFLSFSYLCMSDMSLLLFDTSSLMLLYSSLHNEKRRSILLYLAALSMGFAFLVKGPVGIVLPAVSFALFLTLTGQWKKIRIGDVLVCSLILAGAGVPWFMAATRQNGTGALTYFFIHENLERFLGSTYDTHRPIWFMVQSLFGGMLPWSVFIPFALMASWKTIKSYLPLELNWRDIRIGLSVKESQKHLFLWLWTFVVIGFFSLSRGKIDYYALPVYPAVAILLGNYLSEACDKNSKVATGISWLATVLLLTAGIGSVFVLPGIFPGQPVTNWISMPLVLIASAVVMLVCSMTTQLRKAYKMLFIAVCLIAVSFSWQMYPWITSKQAVLKYIPYIRTLPEHGRVGVFTSLQNWIDEITFQTSTEPMKIETVKRAEQFLKATAPSLLLIQESEYMQMSEEARQNSEVLGSNPFIPRSLNPVYFISKGKKLAETKLLLVSNKAAK